MKIIVSGTTGVGKSTTVNLLKEYYEKKGLEVILLTELVVQSPFFDLYFSDLEEWWLPASLDFMLGRFKQWLYIEEETKHKDPSKYVVLFDRSFLEDIIFSDLREVKLSKSAMVNKSFENLHSHLLEKIKEYEKPDFFILLKASFDTVQERQFDLRARKQETSFHNKYWQDLYYRYYSSKKYRKIFKDYTKEFVEIDTDDSTPKDVLTKVTKYIKNRSDKKI